MEFVQVHPLGRGMGIPLVSDKRESTIMKGDADLVFPSRFDLDFKRRSDLNRICRLEESDGFLPRRLGNDVS